MKDELHFQKASPCTASPWAWGCGSALGTRLPLSCCWCLRGAACMGRAMGLGSSCLFQSTFFYFPCLLCYSGFGAGGSKPCPYTPRGSSAERVPGSWGRCREFRYPSHSLFSEARMKSGGVCGSPAPLSAPSQEDVFQQWANVKRSPSSCLLCTPTPGWRVPGLPFAWRH